MRAQPRVLDRTSPDNLIERRPSANRRAEQDAVPSPALHEELPHEDPQRQEPKGSEEPEHSWALGPVQGADQGHFDEVSAEPGGSDPRPELL